MKSPGNWIAVGLVLALTGLYAGGVETVPFHPDESSWIYMSRDFETLLVHGDLRDFRWSPTQPTSRQMEYRLLNAPAPKYLIGLGRWLLGEPAAPPNDDWDWRLSWAENGRLNHLPTARTLFASRMPGAILSALAGGLMFAIGRRVRGSGAGLAAAVLLGGNALMLLHGRRAMAEAGATFFALLAICLCLMIRPRGKRALRLCLLAGLALGVAIASKQTNVALMPVAIAAGLAPSVRPTITRWGLIVASAGLAFWLLNPILYGDPVRVTQAMVQARAELAEQQSADAEALFPGLSLASPLARLQAAVLQVYFQPLAHWDIPIYTEVLQPQVEAYEQNPIHALTRQWPAAVTLLALTLLGLAFSGLRTVKGPRLNPEVAAWVWGLCTLGLTLTAIPLNWQRYFLPLLPPACLFAALGLESLYQFARQLTARSPA